MRCSETRSRTCGIAIHAPRPPSAVALLRRTGGPGLPRLRDWVVKRRSHVIHHDNAAVNLDCRQLRLSGRDGRHRLLHACDQEARHRRLDRRSSRRHRRRGRRMPCACGGMVALPLRRDTLRPAADVSLRRPFVCSTRSHRLAGDAPFWMARAGSVPVCCGNPGHGARLPSRGVASGVHCLRAGHWNCTRGRYPLGWPAGSRSGRDALSRWPSQGRRISTTATIDTDTCDTMICKSESETTPPNQVLQALVWDWD